MIRLVISATNLVEGGGLQVLRDCIAAAARAVGRLETTAVIHDRRLVDGQGVKIIECPDAKHNWLKRVATEYRQFKTLSDQLKPDIWLSLHDITPNVVAGAQYVYCHNPAPFYQPSLRQMLHEPSFALFNMLYGHLYRINIRKNNAVIVQQDWLKREFVQRYHPRRVIVAAPHYGTEAEKRAPMQKSARIFLYPAFPRTFKNFEIICRAVKLLTKDGGWTGEIRFTISGNENRYARYIADLARDTPEIKLIGRQGPDGMRRQYDEADVILFPSTLETWGLPVSEARQKGKIVMLADLPYAHETLGLYDSACFLDPSDADAWANAMRSAVSGQYTFTEIDPNSIKRPDVAGWDELIDWLIADAGRKV